MKKIVKLSLILVVLSLFSINLFSISVSASECGDFFKENEFMTNSDLSYEIISDNGTNYTRIYLNVKNDVTLNSGEIAYFTYTPEADFYFVVETIGDYDTKLRVENTATGTIINDDSCGNLNAKVEFKGLQGKPVYISTKFFSSSTSGSFTLQLRKQRFSMFGYDDGHGHSTISDLKIPYNAFKSIFESIKYENGSSWEAFANDDRDLARINSEIMFFTGHGYKNDEDNKGFGVSFHTGGITTNDRFLNMKKTKVAMWAACYSANSTNPGNISIAEFSVRHGAQSAVGFSEAVEFSSSKTFTNRFFTKLASGATVKEAAKYGAEGLLWPWDNGKKYVIFGNEEMRVTDSSPTISSFSMRNSNLSIIDNLGDDYEYISLDDTKGRYYKKINGYLTNSFIDVAYENGCIVEIEDYRKDIFSTLNINAKHLNYILPNQKTVGDEIYILEEETLRNIVYYSIDNVMVPVLIIIGNYKKGNQIIEEANCVNLATGLIIDYSTINEI